MDINYELSKAFQRIPVSSKLSGETPTYTYAGCLEGFVSSLFLFASSARSRVVSLADFHVTALELLWGRFVYVI